MPCSYNELNSTWPATKPPDTCLLIAQCSLLTPYIKCNYTISCADLELGLHLYFLTSAFPIKVRKNASRCNSSVSRHKIIRKRLNVFCHRICCTGFCRHTETLNTHISVPCLTTLYADEIIQHGLHEWRCDIGGIMLTGNNRSTRRKTWPTATLS